MPQAADIDVATLCRELDVAWSEPDLVALEAELKPFTDAIDRHYRAGRAIASHVPGSSSLCVPITDVTDPAELFRTAEGDVSREKYEVEEGISYISTGGGAFLEFVEGKRLPAVVALEERAAG